MTRGSNCSLHSVTIAAIAVWTPPSLQNTAERVSAVDHITDTLSTANPIRILTVSQHHSSILRTNDQITSSIAACTVSLYFVGKRAASSE